MAWLVHLARCRSPQRPARASKLIARLSLGIDERDALLVSEMNWQLENVLLYTQRHLRPDLAWVRLGDVMTHWPFLVADNHRIGRDVVLTPQAAADVVAAYGPAYPLFPDDALPIRTLEQAADAVPRGTPYVLSVLTPPREEQLDPEDARGGAAIADRGRVRGAPRARPSRYLRGSLASRRSIIGRRTGHSPIAFSFSTNP